MSTPKSSYPAKIGLIVKMMRALMGVSQGTFADSTDVSRITIARLESMKDVDKFKAPTIDSILATFEELGIDLEFRDDYVSIKIPNSIMDLSAAKANYKPDPDVDMTNRRTRDVLVYSLLTPSSEDSK